ncbi:MAG: peptidoglycan-binding protein [Firmicutes bacterium]|nr:peptidoglycan-binding protein [Bacillota bacterium]
MTRSHGEENRGSRFPLSLATLILVGIICAVVFSRGYSPRISEAPVEIEGELADDETKLSQLSQGHQLEAGTGLSVGEGGGIAPDIGPESVRLCECGELHMLRLCEPRIIGEQVRDLQEGLAVAGFLAGPADGVFGPVTDRSVRTFQASVGLPEDGIVDMSVWMTLGQACEPVIAASLGPSGDLIPTAKISGQLPSGWRALLIDTSNLTITLLEDGLPLKQYRVGIGKPATPTPVGQFKVVDKAAWAGGFGTRWMGLNVPWGKYGIHGTNKPWTVSQRKSGGCIRMLNRDIEELYPMVPVGTPVVITSGHFGTLGSFRPRIEPGAKGSYVLEVQKRLSKLGYEHAGFDGVYGPGTERAIMQLQRDKGLPVTGIVDMLTYEALGLVVFD